MVEALAHSAEHERTTPEKLLARLRENGRDKVIREDLLAQKAIELVADSAKPIPSAEAEDAQRESRGGGEDPRPGGRRRNRRANFGRPATTEPAAGPPHAFYRVRAR